MGEKKGKAESHYQKDSTMDRQLLTATLQRAEKNLLQQQQVFEFAEFCRRHDIKHNNMQEYQAALHQYFLQELAL